MPDASLVLQRYRVFFLAFLKLHFPSKINTTYRADMTTKQTTTHFSVLQCGVRVSLHSIASVTAVVTGNISSVHSQHIYQD